jgi:hypothetical protein
MRPLAAVSKDEEWLYEYKFIIGKTPIAFCSEL